MPRFLDAPMSMAGPTAFSEPELAVDDSSSLELSFSTQELNRRLSSGALPADTETASGLGSRLDPVGAEPTRGDGEGSEGRSRAEFDRGSAPALPGVPRHDPDALFTPADPASEGGAVDENMSRAAGTPAMTAAATETEDGEAEDVHEAPAASLEEGPVVGGDGEGEGAGSTDADGGAGGGTGGGVVADGASVEGGMSSAADDPLSALGTGDVALVDTELAEHLRWGSASARVGASGSADRADFIARAAGAGAIGGFVHGGAMGLAVGAGTRVVELAAVRGAARLAGPALARSAPIPAIGAVIGGVFSAYDLATRDWSRTGETIGRFGEGGSIYEQLANSIAAVSEIIGIATAVLNVIAGIIGAISIAMWVITVLTVGVASPLALTLSTIAGAIGIGTMILDGINALVLQRLVTLFRALHTFTSQADPSDVEAQGGRIGEAAGASAGFVGGMAGGLAGGAAVGRGARALGIPEHPTVPDVDAPAPATGDGPTITADPPPTAVEGAPGSSPEVLPAGDRPAMLPPEPTAPVATIPEVLPVAPDAAMPLPEPSTGVRDSAAPVSEGAPVADPHADTIPAADPHADTIPAADPHADTIPAADPHADTIPAADPHADTIPAADPTAPTELPVGPDGMPEIPGPPRMPEFEPLPDYGPELPDWNPDAPSPYRPTEPAPPPSSRPSAVPVDPVAPTMIDPAGPTHPAPVDPAASTVPALPESPAGRGPRRIADEGGTARAPVEAAPAGTNPFNSEDGPSLAPSPGEQTSFPGFDEPAAREPRALSPGEVAPPDAHSAWLRSERARAEGRPPPGPSRRGNNIAGHRVPGESSFNTAEPRPDLYQHTPRQRGHQSHHVESQTALADTIANYDPARDPTVMMREAEHHETFGPQAEQRADPAFRSDLGTPAALEQAYNIARFGELDSPSPNSTPTRLMPDEVAGQVVSEHVGYLFETSGTSADAAPAGRPVVGEDPHVRAGGGVDPYENIDWSGTFDQPDPHAAAQPPGTQLGLFGEHTRPSPPTPEQLHLPLPEPSNPDQLGLPFETPDAPHLGRAVAEPSSIPNSTRSTRPLTPAEFDAHAALLSEQFGVPRDRIHPGEYTAFHPGATPAEGFITIGPDVNPLPVGERPVGGSNPANAALEPRAVLAHESLGHRDAELAGQVRDADWHEEFQASTRAALLDPGLTPDQRWALMRDAEARRRFAPNDDTIYVWTDPITHSESMGTPGADVTTRPARPDSLARPQDQLPSVIVDPALLTTDPGGASTPRSAADTRSSLPDFTAAEIDAAIDRATAGPLLRAPADDMRLRLPAAQGHDYWGVDPVSGMTVQEWNVGARRGLPRRDATGAILPGPSGDVRTQVRLHSPDATAMPGSASAADWTMNIVQRDARMLPDGRWFDTRYGAAQDGSLVDVRPFRRDPSGGWVAADGATPVTDAATLQALRDWDTNMGASHIPLFPTPPGNAPPGAGVPPARPVSDSSGGGAASPIVAASTTPTPEPVQTQTQTTPPGSPGSGASVAAATASTRSLQMAHRPASGESSISAWPLPSLPPVVSVPGAAPLAGDWRTLEAVRPAPARAAPRAAETRRSEGLRAAARGAAGAFLDHQVPGLRVTYGAYFGSGTRESRTARGGSVGAFVGGLTGGPAGAYVGQAVGEGVARRAEDFNAGFERGSEPVVEPVNPAYPPPPGNGTRQELVDMQNRLLSILDARSRTERLEGLMSSDAQHHEGNTEPLSSFNTRTGEALSATDAHQQAVAARKSANQSQQAEEGNVGQAIADYGNRQAGLAVIKTPLEAFTTFTYLGHALPDSPSVLLGAKRGILKMNTDGRNFLNALDGIDTAVATQEAAQPGRGAEIDANAARLDGTEGAAGSSRTSLADAQSDGAALATQNNARAADSRQREGVARQHGSRLDDDAERTRGEITDLSAQWQSWAQAHRQARVDAMDQTRAAMIERGWRPREESAGGAA